MTICPDCKQEIISSRGCSVTYLLIGGNKYKRLTGGYEKGKNFEKDLTRSGEELRCEDCGALEGNVHHFGCESEACPIHKTSLTECLCEEARVCL
jgi:hypothetical protein